MEGLTYWWKKYQNIKGLLSKYMKENGIQTVELAIVELLKPDYEKEVELTRIYNKNMKGFVRSLDKKKNI